MLVTSCSVTFQLTAIPQGDWILFYHEGGVDVGDVDAKAEKLLIPVDLSQYPSNDEIAKSLLSKVPKGVHNVLIDFISRLYAVYVDCQFTYLEINPLVAIPNADKTSAEVHFLDLAAKLDQTAEFECGSKWAIARAPAQLGIPVIPGKTDGKVTIDVGPPMEFPAPFGRELSKEEAYIAEMDAKTGASLKLTILNGQGRVWTLVAGGGASVVYADAIASAGFAGELANYGEYSGAPTETQTFYYARTVLDLMLRAPQHKEGKVLFIGGGIANFTNVSMRHPHNARASLTTLSSGRIHIQGRDPRPPRSRSSPDRAQGPDLGASRWTQLPGRPEEHQGCRQRAEPRYARVRAGDARQRHRAIGFDSRQDE
jgi:ATP citrate (pro-S)-lyase